MKMPRIPRKVREELEKQDDWTADIGARHIKIKINGVLAGVTPINAHDDGGRSVKNVIAQIRRARKGLVPA